MEKWLDDLYDLCDTVSKEIGDANEKIKSAGGKLSGADVEYIDKLTHTMKSIKTVIAMDNRHGKYSSQRRDSRGRFSRESRRGYSMDDARMDFIEDVRELMSDAPDEHMRMKFKRFIEEIENA